jgi:transposase
MANKTLSMQKVRDIIQLSVKGYSYRQISKITGIHRTIVSNYIRCIEKSEVGLEGSLQLSDKQFLLILKKEDEQVPSKPKQLWLNNFFVYAKQELQKKHVTRQLLYGEYVNKYPESYSYSQFCELLNQSLKKEAYSLFQTYHPGEIMMADFAGDKLFYIDKETGEQIRCEVLVITLGYSGYTFVIALPNQTQESFIEGLNNALIFFGGSVKIILFDNLKAGVTKSDPYEPSFNALMDMFCRHYDLVPQATRVAKPKDKAQVESHVNIIYKRIYGPLRNRTFFSLAELNASIIELLVEHNNKAYRGTSKSRCNFYHEERQHLRPLPASLFKQKYLKKATAQKNYHVWLGHDEHYYSFPFRYVGKEVSIVYDTSTVEIYCDYERIAVHERKRKIGRYSTLPEHMPDNHIAVKNGIDPEYLKRQAALIGEYVLEFAIKLLDKGLLTPQHFKSCRGVLSLAKKYPKERVDNACKRALLYNNITYKSVEGILQKNLDALHQDQLPSLPHNPNTRGHLNFI